MSAPQTPVWVDEQTPDPGWRPPVESESAPVVRRRRPHPLLIGVLAIALVLTAVWALGGFKQRKDLRVDTAAGALISTGPYEFTFTKATAQHVDRFGDKVTEVIVYGMGRTTGDEAITPSSLDSMFAAFDEKTRESHEMDSQQFGPGTGFDHGDSFTPGLPPVQYSVTFEFSAQYQPGSSIAFAVSSLEYSDTSLLGTGEKLWNNADDQYVMDLPLTKLPDEK